MANLLINTTVGGNAVITTSNIGSYALTSLPSHNHDDRYFTETESDGRFQPLENQRLSTSNGPTFANVYNSGWFRNYGAQGMYNQDYGTHFYSNGATSWAITGSGGNVQLEFRSNHQSTIRGFVYADTSNQIGFLNNAGDWSLRTNSSRDTQIYGALTVGSGTSADIYMTDTDETTRRIHTNSGRIGFLNAATNWGAYCDNTGNWFSDHSMRAPIFYDSADVAYYVDPNATTNIWRLQANDKYHYFGASSGWDTGSLNGANSSITNVHFQAHEDFWIGAGNTKWYTGVVSGHHDLLINTMQSGGNNVRGITFTASSGGASVYRLGRWFAHSTQVGSYLNVDGGIKIGGTTDTYSPPAAKLQVISSTSGSDVLAVDGVNGRLFTVTDDLSDSLFSVNTIAGLPVIEAFADNTVKIGKYGSNSITISNSKIAINSDTVDANFPFYVGDRSVAGSRYSLTNKGMGFNLADNYAQLQLYGGNGSYIDFVTTSGQDSAGRIMWDGNFNISGTTYFANNIYTYTLYDRNDNAYYLDMNGTSRLGTLNINQLSVYGNTYLGDGNGDEVHINDILRVGATDSGDAHFYFGEGGSAGSDYGSHWYWDSGYTFTWYTRNNGSDTALFNYVTNDTTYVNWSRHFNMQNREVNYVSQLHFNAGTRFINSGANYLYFQVNSDSYGSIQVRDQNSGLRGHLGYFDANGFGLLNSSGSWGIRLNPGNVGTELFYAGDWKLNTRSGGVGVSGNLYTDQNYGHGLVGLYASTRYQGVFAMGDSYKLTADGTGTGTLYGIAWTHTNVGGQSKSGLGHQALFMDNGTTQTAIGTGIWTNGLITTTSYGTSANWNTAFGWGNHASAGYLTGITSGQVTGALGYTPYNSSNPSGYITGYTETDTLQSVTSRGSTTTTSITADRFRGNNTLVLNTFTTVNPASNVFLYSQPNDRDSWIYLDSADTGSNWGIYHRQIDSAVGGMEGNSIGFIGGGASALRAYIGLSTGNGYFAGTLSASNFSGTSSGTNTGDQTNISGNAATATYATTAGSAPANGGNSSTVGGYSVSVGASANTIPTRNANGYLIPESWIQLNGIYGLYSPTNGAHLRPNDGTYGSWMMTGSRNSWQGIEFNSGNSGNVTLMINVSSNTVGFHNNSYGWQFFWESGTLYCFKNAYGGGTQATVLDSSNYSTWAQPIASAINTGNIGSQSVSNASTAGGLAVHSSRNNEANKIVRTDANGYIQAGWINTPSGVFSSAITKIYCSDDDYVRFQTPATFISNLGLITTSNIGSQSVSYATTAGTANAVAWGNVSSKPSLLMYYQGFTLDANTMDGNSTGFTYSVNAPYTGPIARFSETGYSLQLNAAYAGSGTGIAFRTRNGDAGSFNPWRVLLNDANYTAYSPSLTGSGASGSWGISVTGSAGSVAWTNVSSRPTALSQFTNDLGNYGGFLTSITAHSHAISDVTGLQTALDGKQAAGSYAASSHTHDDRYYTESESDTRFARRDADSAISGNLVIGNGTYGNSTAYGNSGARLMFSGSDGDAQGNYYIGTNHNDYGGNYSKLELRWHTGIRMGAQPGYGGIRFYDTEDLGTVIFSVGTGDSHVRVVNNLYVGGNLALHAGNYTSYSPTLTGGNASGTWGINVTGSAGSISGFNNPATGATANTIVYRDSSGDIYGRYIFGSYHNSSDNVDTGSITYIMAKFGDNYHRSATAAKVQAFLGLGSLAYSSATIPTNNNQLTNGAGYITGINSGNVTTALGFTPYNATNPSGYITSSASISGNAATATYATTAGSAPANGGNSATVGGYAPSGSVGANTVVIRDANNYIYAHYINSNVSETENPTINSFYTSNGDGWLRKSSVAHVKSQLGLGSMAYESSGTYQTVSGAINTGNIASQSVSYATISQQLTKFGDIYGQDWNSYFITAKLIVSNALGHTGANRPSDSYGYGTVLSYGETGGPLMQMYFPEDVGNTGGAYRALAYRSGYNGGWSPWKTVVNQVGNTCTVAGSNGTGLQVHSNVGYNQNPLTYFLLRGQADSSWKTFKILLTGDAGGQDIEFRRIAENSTDARMFYVPRGLNQVIFDYTVVQPSDSRLKDNLTPITNPVDKIKSLRGVEFDWNSGEHVGTHDVGLIAQDVEAVLPEAVTTQEDGYKNLAYTKVIPLLVEAMKEQQTMIEALRAEIELLKNK